MIGAQVMSLQRTQTNTPTTDTTGATARSVALTHRRIGDPTLARKEFGQIARDPHRDIRERTLATAGLARITDREAIEELETLVDAEGPVAIEALRALGRRGGPELLPTINKVLAGKRTRAVQRSASFAATLIAHRHGIAGHDLRSSPARARTLPVVPAGVREMKFEAAGAEAMSGLHRSLAHDTPGLELGPNGWLINCRGRISVFALNLELANTWQSTSFAKRKFHVGQIALRNDSNGEFSPGLTLLSDPDGAGGFIVGGYRSDGTLVLSGRGKPEGESVSVQLAAVDRIAAFPLDLHIIISPDKATVVKAKVGPATTRNHPQPAAR